ncbi:arylsulfotransferase family protein [Aspergillus saccharolyticus JOP 1030-1]|uniref:ASST-domain-containing protein n=1 Tax=Aspergillus saccharolyticus JOP 1030-1 TaxID=1450539 RepID=A0A318ZC81_9EURO|nr:hypothetical protein BP01DRAFT_340920 [Aspergillus saccharolyticus JOP 1030-1]PYH45015.1 hypothetical protein BP01DRAFT_340920 [Aspergillus saccharolyticus JOP 1030-1]
MLRSLPFACSVLQLLLLATPIAADNFPYVGYRTAPFLPPQLKVTKTGPTDPGYIFVGPRGNQGMGTAALIYDEDGQLVYEGPQEVTANFRTQRLFNEEVITFWAGDMTDLGFGYGTVHILDNTYREIYTVTLGGGDLNFVSPFADAPASYIDLHESHVTERNTLLVTAYNVTQHDLTVIGGAPDDYMLDGMFFEIDIATNEIVYAWSAVEHLAEIPLEGSKQGLGPEYGTKEKPWDAYHINSVELMEDGYIISLRHYWSGFYVHNNGTVMWRLSGEKNTGDFEIDDQAVFSWQHDIRVYNQTQEGLVLSLFNNANTPTETVAATTGLSFYVDLANHKVSTLRALSDSSDVIHSVSQGSYQLLSPQSGHVVLGYGSIARVKEYDASGKAVMTAQFGEDNAVASYRGFKCQWKATPFWPPAVVAIRTTDEEAQVSMSWNGATEYDNWAIYAVEGEKLVKSVKREGFETTVELSGLREGYVQVVARQGNIPLGMSEVIYV